MPMMRSGAGVGLGTGGTGCTFRRASDRQPHNDLSEGILLFCSPQVAVVPGRGTYFNRCGQAGVTPWCPREIKWLNGCKFWRNLHSQPFNRWGCKPPRSMYLRTHTDPTPIRVCFLAVAHDCDKATAPLSMRFASLFSGAEGFCQIETIPAKPERSSAFG